VSRQCLPAHGALAAGADGAGHLHEPLLVHLRNQRTRQTDLNRADDGATNGALEQQQQLDK
jgi:hypothetical protein